MRWLFVAFSAGVLASSLLCLWVCSLVSHIVGAVIFVLRFNLENYLLINYNSLDKGNGNCSDHNQARRCRRWCCR